MKSLSPPYHSTAFYLWKPQHQKRFGPEYRSPAILHQFHHKEWLLDTLEVYHTELLRCTSSPSNPSAGLHSAMVCKGRGKSMDLRQISWYLLYIAATERQQMLYICVNSFLIITCKFWTFCWGLKDRWAEQQLHQFQPMNPWWFCSNVHLRPARVRSIQKQTHLDSHLISWGLNSRMPN